MPDAMLKFELPKEESEFKCALNGLKWQGVLLIMQAHLRTIRKYDENQIKSDFADELLKMMHEEMDEKGISFED
jgi:hypothetical protein